MKHSKKSGLVPSASVFSDENPFFAQAGEECESCTHNGCESCPHASETGSRRAAPVLRGMHVINRPHRRIR